MQQCFYPAPLYLAISQWILINDMSQRIEMRQFCFVLQSTMNGIYEGVFFQITQHMQITRFEHPLLLVYCCPFSFEKKIEML